MSKTSSFGDLTAEEREALARRIRVMVDAAGTQAKAARMAQVSVRQIAAYVAGESAPPLLPLARLARETGISLDWVVDGRGPQRRGDSTRLNGELATRILEVIRAAYRDAGVALPDRELGRLMVAEYEDMSDAGVIDEDEEIAMVRLIGAKHRRLLATETPVARKRGA